MYYPDGAGHLGEELVRLPDGSIVTREQAQQIMQQMPINTAGTPVGVEPPVGPAGTASITPARTAPAPTFKRSGEHPLYGPNPETRTAPAPTFKRSGEHPLYGPNPEDAPAPAQADTGGVGGLLGWLGKTPAQKEKMNQGDLLMALGSGMMGLSADPNLQKLGMAGFGQVADNRKTRQALAKSNRTVDALVGSGMIKPEQADILRNNPSLINEVYKAALKGDNAAIAKYKWLLNNPEEAAKLKELGAIGSGVEVNMPGQVNEDFMTQLQKEVGKDWASYYKQGATAVGLQSDLNMLKELYQYAPTGIIPGALSERFRGLSTVGDAIESIKARLAPRMRVEGSGSTSDMEMQKMLDSLGSLRSDPSVNAFIIEAFQTKLDLDIKRRGVVADFQAGRATWQEAADRMGELDAMSVLPPQLRATLDNLTGGGTAFDQTELPENWKPMYEQLDPARRETFLTFTPEQQQALWEAWVKERVAK